MKLHERNRALLNRFLFLSHRATLCCGLKQWPNVRRDLPSLPQPVPVASLHLARGPPPCHCCMSLPRQAGKGGSLPYLIWVMC